MNQQYTNLRMRHAPQAGRRSDPGSVSEWGIHSPLYCWRVDLGWPGVRFAGRGDVDEDLLGAERGLIYAGLKQRAGWML